MYIENIRNIGYIKEDSSASLILKVLDYDNQPFDLKSNDVVKVEILVGINEGRLFTKEPILHDEPGVLEFELDKNDNLILGANLVEIHIHMVDGAKYIAPSRGYFKLMVERNIDSLGEADVTKVTLDFFLDQVDERIAQIQGEIDLLHDTREYFETHLDETVDLAVDNKMTPFVKLRFQQGVATITGVNSNGYFRSSDPFVTVAIDGFPQINAPNYDVLVTPISGDAGLVGRLEVYDKTQNGFKVKMTGSASSVTFLWTILNPNV